MIYNGVTWTSSDWSELQNKITMLNNNGIEVIQLLLEESTGQYIILYKKYVDIEK